MSSYGVIVFPVVAKTGNRFPDLLTKRRIALAGNILPSQRPAEGVPCVVIADLRRYAATGVVDVLRPVAAGLGGNALQAVGIVCRLLARGLRDHHAVAVQDIPSQVGGALRSGDAAQQAVGVVGVSFSIPVLTGIALQQVQGVIGIAGRPSGGLPNQVAHLVVGVLGGLLAAGGLGAPPQSIILVGGGNAIHTLDGDQPVHPIVDILCRFAVGIGHGEAVAVTVVGVADGVAARLGDGEETACVVVLVLRHARGGGNRGQIALLF